LVAGAGIEPATSGL